MTLLGISIQYRGRLVEARSLTLYLTLWIAADVWVDNNTVA